MVSQDELRYRTTRYHIKPKIKALAIAGACSEKKARDIVVMDMRKMSGVCDFFVIARGTSSTQVRAISDNITRRLKEKGERVWHVEGEREALWVLLDAGDVVCHVFQEQTRRFYDLERLWADAPRERFKETGVKSVRKIKAKTKSKPKARPKKAKVSRNKKNKTKLRRKR